MTFISYAQNFEDVMLWRALRTVADGFYIDIGAAHPETDSVTRAFYDRGWAGINVEPVPEAAARLRGARLRDATLQVAVGEAPGQAEFFVVEGTGLSTTRRDLLAGYEQGGFQAHRIQVEMRTLADICREHAPGPIHFLKIDVEGAEQAVLAGADFHAFRPWIVLAEATEPMSDRPAHAGWEGILLRARYRFAWFDGLNRFYVAEERAAELLPYFVAPPNVFDDFVRAADTEWARRIGQAEANLASAGARADAAEERAERAALRLALEAALTAQVEALAEHRGRDIGHLADEIARIQALHAESERERERVRAGLAGAHQQVLDAHRRLAAAEHRAHAAEVLLQATRSSTSWKVTAPMRRLMALAGGPRPAAADGGALPIPGNAADGTDVPASAPPGNANGEPEAPVLDEAPPDALPRPVPGRPLRAVHQFHAGSATGDAITNAMLLTRDVLRQAGFRSDIYVEHRDPALACDLLLVDDLPRHADYVLLVRHSMGHGCFARLVELPSPKVLLYHNITPPQHLGDAVLRHAARLGREQLADWRPHVAAALADSEYNALELRGLGFDPVQACPLLFDVTRMAAPTCSRSGERSLHPTQDDAPFTILFVGRIIESKGQLDLIESFARFHRAFGRPARLVLVGRHDGARDVYLESLHEAVRRHHLQGHVIITGAVSDGERDGWYEAADLYVSLSRHEGFGVPLVEAQAHGVPVLAWPAGATPTTLRDAAELLDDDAPSATAQRMLALARNPVRRAALAAQGRQAVGAFRLDRHVPRLFQALVRAGAALPRDPAARDALAAGMRFTVTGHVSSTYSLAAVNRALAAAIEAERPGQVRLLPIEGVPTADITRVPMEQAREVSRLAGRLGPATGPQVVISQHYPVHVPVPPGDLPLALFFWEESVIPADTVSRLNAGFRGVLAPSCFVARALLDSGVRLPIRVLGQSPRLAPFHALREERLQDARPPGTVTNFLHVSSCFPRKGVDLLLAAFAAAFRRVDPVRLVIKGHPNPHNTVAEQLAALQAADPEAPEITFINADIGETELLALYRDADVMVLPARGEGYNLPAAEAMAAGIPLIVTGYGGHLDFCGPEQARLLEYRFAPAESHLSSAGSVWVEPDAADLAAALREVAADPVQIRARADRAAARITRETSSTALMERLAEAALDILLTPPPEPARIAWVSSWGVRCGVGEYSRQLVTHLPPDGLAGVVVVADRRAPDAVAIAREAAGAPVRVRRDWTLGAENCAAEIAAAVAQDDPHIVVLQHQPGLLEWAALAQLLRERALRGRAVVVALHNTRHLLEIDRAERADAVAALGGAARIVVHTVADLNLLKGLGLTGNAVLVPQGAPAAIADGVADAEGGAVPRPLQREDVVLIGCYGFLLPGKGVPELIRALTLLRRAWPGARLRLVNAVYPGAEAELAACQNAAAGLEDAVAFETGFLPQPRSMDLLRECDLIVLPYQASLESSSAALRTALGAGVPVCVTPLPLFDEAGDSVLRLPGVTPDALAEGIAAALSDADARAAVVRAARRWVQDRGWDRIGQRFAGMLRGLALRS